MASLKFDEAALVLDFGENHSFNNQGCAQSYHWNNAKMRQQSIYLHLNPETKKISNASFIYQQLRDSWYYYYLCILENLLKRWFLNSV